MELGTGAPRNEYLMGMAATVGAQRQLENAAASGQLTDAALAANAGAKAAYGVTRNLRIFASSMRHIGILNEDTYRAISMMAAGAQAGRAVFGIIRAVIGLRKAMQMQQLGLAAAETTVQIAAQNYVGIAVAVGASVGVIAAFKTGEYIGELSRPHEVQYTMTKARRDAVG